MSDYKPTREELEAAIAETAWAYYMKGPKLQYDSQQLCTRVDKFHGGRLRITDDAAPEDATSDEAAYTVCSDYIYKTYYHALGQRIAGAVHNLDVVTKALWTYSDDAGITVLRWWRDDYQQEEAEHKYGVTEKYRVSMEEGRAFLANWKENLRIGDILMPSGHATMYIGNGYVIDANGYKYDTETGVDNVEPYGTVCKLRKIQDIFLDGTDVGRESCLLRGDTVRKYFLVCRPLNAMMEDPQLTITPAGRSRLKYPGMEIDRTVDITPYGTAQHGGEITYRVVISNKSDEPVYAQHRRYIDSAYAPQEYAQLSVTETVPNGTELVWAPGATVSGRTLSWKLDIPAGKSATVFYTVKVTAPVGSVIINGDGVVDEIPSNTISNKVGKPRAYAKHFTKGELLSWIRNCTAVDAAFVNKVYFELLQQKLDLPSSEVLRSTLFRYETVKKRTILRDLCVLQGKMLKDLNREIAIDAWVLADSLPRMAIMGYAGGKLTELPGIKPINDFRLSYLEQGDVLVYINETGKNRILVYMGDKTVLSMYSDGTGELLYDADAHNAIWQAMSWDVFFALRPTQ